jgi:hypothetical protein
MERWAPLLARTSRRCTDRPGGTLGRSDTTTASSGISVRGDQGRLRLPPKAARAEGPPRTRLLHGSIARSAPAAGALHSPEGGQSAAVLRPTGPTRGHELDRYGHTGRVGYAGGRRRDSRRDSRRGQRPRPWWQPGRDRQDCGACQRSSTRRRRVPTPPPPVPATALIPGIAPLRHHWPSGDRGGQHAEGDISRRWMSSTGRGLLAAVLVDLLLERRPGGVEPLQVAEDRRQGRGQAVAADPGDGRLDGFHGTV